MSDKLPLDSMGSNSQDDLGTPLKIVSFCIPLVGAILYFTTDANQFPTKRQQACNFALYGVGVGILFQVLALALGSASR
jgi:hypothetical protein